MLHELLANLIDRATLSPFQGSFKILHQIGLTQSGNSSELYLEIAKGSHSLEYFLETPL
jgi:hypothetical protein